MRASRFTRPIILLIACVSVAIVLATHEPFVQSSTALSGARLALDEHVAVSELLRIAPNDGDLDPSFNPIFNENLFFTVVIQADGKILTGGRRDSIIQGKISRLNLDGSLDSTFNPGNGANREIFAITPQTDGKILIGGFFVTFNGVARNRIARIDSNGSLDPSFDPGSGANGTVKTIAIQSDGKILIGGNFTTYNGVGRNGIARLHIDGSLDPSFNPGSGVTLFGRFVEIIRVQIDGKILIGGSFEAYDGVTRNGIARINLDGSLDTTFDPGSGPNTSQVLSMAVQSDGKIFIGSGFSAYSGVTRMRVARINPDGSLDTAFNSGFNSSANFVRSFAIQNNGKVLFGGSFTTYSGVSRPGIVRTNSDGTL